ncbi:restriction endonuclease subunit S [Kaistella flava (ex Peng et al. 2021)]|uniref:Restriction endonuclease subunit S n=1 Tax=Kaistella flava (ex Peng et al. 2021) TaxID=2038776 RepID=A0A7M2YC12_9FLAO|nr:restriction endonuclease subunit S [Kaistella flava (ex Peng et al. 2021)]QOW11646.1 restriction endonuclease subunit S [Kaistella flava (ex Peng et al. 2021)]
MTKEYILKDLLKIKNGKDHKTIPNGNIPIFGSGGIMRFGNQFIYDKPSILLPRKGTLPNIQFSKIPFWTVDTIYYTQINALIAEPYFLYNYLKILNLENLNTGTAVPSMTFESYYNLKIQLPNLDVQKKIANILGDIDNKIDLNNQLNDNLERMAKTLYDYWFVQFDFPDENGKPYKSSGGEMVFNDVLKRKVPIGWEVKRLYQIANITMGQSPSGTSYNVDEKGMIFFQGSTDFGWRFPTNRIYTTEPTRFSFKDDILLSVRAPIGTMNISSCDCCIGRGLAALNSKEGYNSYLIYQMNYFKKKFDYLNSVGTTFGSLTKDDLYNLQLIYPSNNILLKFDKIVSNFDKKIKINSTQNQQLNNLRDWLLPMLMNGQVKVE